MFETMTMPEPIDQAVGVARGYVNNVHYIRDRAGER